MFGISGYEIVIVLVVILMLFGSKEIPMLARTLGKLIHQIKNASNELKSEINKSAGLDDITKPITAEIEKAKSQMASNLNPLEDSKKSISKIEEDIETIVGPIKRMK